jgi:hypothetical protein
MSDIIQQPKTLALLFIIIDNLPFESIWRRWIENNDERNIQVQVLIHAKFPEKIQSNWVKTKLTKKSFRPEWGSVEITRAMITLAEESLLGCNTQSMRMLYCSESCLPILPFNDCVRELWSSNTSWLDIRRKPRNGYNGSSQWVPIEKSPLIPSECVCKSDQWVCLTRQHAERVIRLPLMVNHDDMWQAFKKGCASDEMYFATMLSCVGALPSRKEKMEVTNTGTSVSIINGISGINGTSGINGDIGNNGNNSSSSSGESGTTFLIEGEVLLRKLTYVEWIYPDLDDYSGKSNMADRPVLFDGLTQSLVNRARSMGCLFARKFRYDGDVNQWERLVLIQEKQQKE